MARRLILIAALAATTTACSPAQTLQWASWHAEDPEAAVDWAVNHCGELCTNDTNNNGVVEPDATDPAPESNGSNGSDDDESSSNNSSSSSGGGGSGMGSGSGCDSYYDEAMNAGFSDGQWSTVKTLMQRESGCNPGAYNPSGASGLMQVMSMWADDCGGSSSDLFSPSFNMRCAHHVYEVQGWDAWSTY